MQFEDALTLVGAGAEAGQVDNKVVSIKSQLLAFRQQRALDLNSEIHSLSQRKKITGSIRSASSSVSCASSSSSTRRARFAELERIRVQQQYEQQATELQLQDEETANQSRLEAGQERLAAEQVAEKTKLAAEQTKLAAEQSKLAAEQARENAKLTAAKKMNDANLRTKKVQFQVDQLLRDGEIAGIERELDIWMLMTWK